MYIVGEPSYRSTNWYLQILSPLKALARRKRTVLVEVESASDADVEETCAFVLGGSARWIIGTVGELQARGIHPVVLSELPDGILCGRCSRVRTDYHRFMSRLALEGLGPTAFYGMNPASMSDRARRDAFLSCFPSGEVFENVGSLARCFSSFAQRHAHSPFASVICANDLAAVSLLCHLRESGARAPTLTVHASGQILSYFPEIRRAHVDPATLSGAAFAIADTVRQCPDFLGMEITVDDAQGVIGGGEVPTLARCDAEEDCLWEDGELEELMRIERLLSECDETDLTILRLLRARNADIGEQAYLSDNGVKYRIKKMKRICHVESKSEIPVLLEKYGIEI